MRNVVGIPSQISDRVVQLGSAVARAATTALRTFTSAISAAGAGRASTAQGHGDTRSHAQRARDRRGPLANDQVVAGRRGGKCEAVLAAGGHRPVPVRSTSTRRGSAAIAPGDSRGVRRARSGSIPRHHGQRRLDSNTPRERLAEGFCLTKKIVTNQSYPALPIFQRFYSYLSD